MIEDKTIDFKFLLEDDPANWPEHIKQMSNETPSDLLTDEFQERMHKLFHDHEPDLNNP